MGITGTSTKKVTITKGGLHYNSQLILHHSQCPWMELTFSGNILAARPAVMFVLAAFCQACKPGAGGF